MINLQLQLELHYDVGPQGCDFIFNIHAAHTRHQLVTQEHLRLSQDIPSQVDTDPATGNRQLRLQALAGPLTVSYAAHLEIRHHMAAPASLKELSVATLPAHVLPYLYPSRYCQSDRLLKFAGSQFGQLPQGHGRVQAIQDWVLQHVTFTSNTSNSNTSAVDTLIERVGVCRDFAHLMIALCRAVNIPARFTTGTDYGAPLSLGPPDFHAYVEVFLSGRWYIFDPSGTAIPMGFMRLATGRDAADVAFATMFGAVGTYAPVIRVDAIASSAGDAVMPHPCDLALSTDEDRMSPRWSTEAVHATAN